MQENYTKNNGLLVDPNFPYGNIIKAVTFAIDDVLITHAYHHKLWENGGNVWKIISDYVGKDPKDLKKDWHDYRVQNPEGSIALDAALKVLNADDVDEDEIIRGAGVSAKAYKDIRPAIKNIRELAESQNKGQGIKLLVVTNNSQYVMDHKLKTAGIEDLFDEKYSAETVVEGSRFTPGVYQELLAMNGIQPGEAVHIVGERQGEFNEVHQAKSNALMMIRNLKRRKENGHKLPDIHESYIISSLRELPGYLFPPKEFRNN